MKKLFIILILLVIVGFFLFKIVKNKVRNDLTQIVPYPSVSVSPTTVLKPGKLGVQQKSLFVPYWALGKTEIDAEDYDEFFYFGITPGQDGINKKEAGFIGINKFLDSLPKTVERKLVVRMIDSNITFPILKDPAKQNSIIKDSITIAKDNGFSGIVLDLEISAVPFDSLINQINKFTKVFNDETEKNKLEFTIMFYGDTFYRLRPFDIKTLSKNADKFMIMSYDFSKSRGNPGPNFPLRGKEVYGYDMTVMIDDFLRYLPADKTSVVFGLFGYDWIVDDKGKAINQGEPVTYQQIKGKFLEGCDFVNCIIRRKNDSTETEITYIDSENKKHVVWFEDMESSEKKEKYLQLRGINSFGFWAYSYF